MNIIFRHRRSDAAFDWFKENNLAVRDLTPNGLHTLTLMLLQNGRVEETRDALIEASAAQIEEAPYFLFLRGAARLACLFPKPDQALPLQGLPLDVRSAHIVVSEDTAAEQLDLAIAEFTRFQPMARDLQLDNAGRIAQAYLVWCELLHPRRKAGAVERLRADMTSPQSALNKLQFAFAFIGEFDPAPIAHYLERRQQLGGLDDNDLRAALVLRMHGDSPREVADFLAKYHTRLEASFGKPGILSIEIQALTLAGDAASAKLLLQENEGIFERDFVAGLEAGIEKAEGADPVQAYRRAYEEARTPEALRALVRELARKKDHGALAGYAEELYRTTNDPEDIALAADAFFRAGDKTNFVRLAEQHGFLLDSYPHIARHYAWELFYLGRLDEARRVTDQFAAKGPLHRDLQLEIALAVETGEWERLAQPLAAYFDDADQFEGAVLIRAAHTAQASGHGPMLDLMKAAVQRAGNDPEVLLGAYLLTVEEGLEDTIAHSHEWFRRAVDLSGEDGPVRRFELKELLSQQTEWNERSRTVSEGISRGDFPLAIAAPGLRMTVVDAVLGSLVRNTASTDPRRMAAIPLFSGRRAPQRLGDVRRIAFDSSALMVLGWLGLLPKVFTTFPEIVLPAGTLLEFFEGRRRIRSFQKSRLKRAAEIRDVIAARRVRIVQSPGGTRDPLADEIGADLAGLIRAAQVSDGVVLRPAPVHCPGLDMQDADMSAHMGRLTDMHALLDTLAQLDVLDQTAEETAKGYFSLQDRGWPSPVRPDVKRPLYIDDLALNYLQTTNLLGTVLNHFSEVHIEASAEKESAALIDHDRHVGEVLRIIDDIREAVRVARANGKILFGPRRSQQEEDAAAGPDPSVMHLLSNLCAAETAVFDDRALNKEPFAQDGTGFRARSVTSLDIIEELVMRSVITETDRRSFRHRLRVAGAMLMPVDVEEIVHAAMRSKAGESREFRAIRENLDLAQIAEMPRFPAEIPWFGSFAINAKSAVMRVWMREKDFGQSSRPLGNDPRSKATRRELAGTLGRQSTARMDRSPRKDDYRQPRHAGGA